MIQEKTNTIDDVRPVGRPTEIKDGKRVNVYLDSKSLDIAAKLGDGNVSEGIRKALQNSINKY